MAIEIGILLALASMLSWGIADFLAKKAIDKIGYVKSLLLNQSIAIVPLFIYSVIFFGIPSISLNLIIITVIAGILGIVGYFTFYKGLQKGNISIVSPIGSSWGIVTTILAIIFFNEELTIIQSVGIVFAFAGIFLTSTNLKELKKGIRKGMPKGVLEAIITMFSWGISFALIKLLSNVVGGVVSTFFIRTVMLVSLFSWVSFKKLKINIPKKYVILFVIGSGLLDVFGFVTYNIGMTKEYLSIVTPIAATYPAITVLLAYIFLKERIANNQKLGIIAILIGLVMVSIV